MSLGDVMGKHHININCDEATKRLLISKLFLSVRSQVLQKLLLLWFNVYFRDLQGKLMERLVSQGVVVNRANLVRVLTSSDVMPMLHCSKRTAIEYIDALKVLMV